MYRTCIFCSADLGSNESLEEFPVGRSIAFDAWKGRLWAVCPRCARWNLAPIEERWEATESAEKLFHDSRLRAHSENVGLAKLPDGTRLVRIGEALPGEMAAWRYGGQLTSRRNRYILATAGVAVLAGTLAFGVPALLAAAGISAAGMVPLVNAGNLLYQRRRAQRVVHRFGADDSPTGEPLELRRFQLNGARLEDGGDGDVALHLPNALESVPRGEADGRSVWSISCLVVRGPAARTVLGRAMVDANATGASRRDLDDALELLGRSRSADEYLRSVAVRQAALPLKRVPDSRRRRARRVVGRLRGDAMPPEVRPNRTRLPRPASLALEMALHEEAERRALQGELAALEAAWREAEEIAAIADALPNDPLDRVKQE